MRNDPEVRRAVDSFQLGLPRVPVSGRSGELLGRGSGSSLEFQEYREYLPGDDIRHLDWSAFARTDTLMVRMYREEISPRTEILLDTSLSMTSGEGIKESVARQLTALFALLSGRLGGRPNIVLLGETIPPVQLGIEGLELLTEFPFSASNSLADMLEENVLSLRRGSVRIVISDFMFPHDPASLIRKLAADAGALWVIQLLGQWESDPTPFGGRRLTDIETGAESDLVIDSNTVAAYRRRLTHLQDELARSCRRAHAPFVKLIAERGLAVLCRQDLCMAGLLRPS